MQGLLKVAFPYQQSSWDTKDNTGQVGSQMHLFSTKIKKKVKPIM